LGAGRRRRVLGGRRRAGGGARGGGRRGRGSGPGGRRRRGAGIASPVRTCVGCRRRRPAHEMRRIVLVDGELREGRTLPGRGAWLCPERACAELAMKRRSIPRALRADIPPDSVAGFLDSWVG